MHCNQVTHVGKVSLEQMEGGVCDINMVRHGKLAALQVYWERQCGLLCLGKRKVHLWDCLCSGTQVHMVQEKVEICCVPQGDLSLGEKNPLFDLYGVGRNTAGII